MKKSILFISFLFILACSKEETTTPVTPTTPTTPTTPAKFEGCRVDKYTEDFSQGSIFASNFDKDGFIVTHYISDISRPNNIAQTTNLAYANGLLTTISSNGFQEQYEYINGIISKIKIANTTEALYRGYEIVIENDANKRIVKMTDNKNSVTTIKRDSKGNITEILKKSTTDNSELYRVERSDYDDKKTIWELYKGWQFNIMAYYGDYMIYPFFTIGASGNPRKEKHYDKGKLSEDLDFTYEYSTEGYPTTITSVNKINGEKKIYRNALLGCK